MEPEFQFIGWVKEGNHDKVWTSFTLGNSAYCAWGRRDAKLQFKQHPSVSALRKVENKKREKYKEVDAFLLFTIFPYFKEQVAQDLVVKSLQNKIK